MKTILIFEIFNNGNENKKLNSNNYLPSKRHSSVHVIKDRLKLLNGKIFDNNFKLENQYDQNEKFLGIKCTILIKTSD